MAKPNYKFEKQKKELERKKKKDLKRKRKFGQNADQVQSSPEENPDTPDTQEDEAE